MVDTTRSEAEEGCGQERPGCRHRGPEVQGAGRRGGPVRRGEARRRGGPRLLLVRGARRRFGKVPFLNVCPAVSFTLLQENS